MASLEESLHSQQLASQERGELKQRVVALEQEKSDVLTGLSNIKEECVKLKSELSDVKRDCESSIPGLKEEVAPRTPQDPMVQRVKVFVWKSSGDVCVSGIRHVVERFESPPMTSGVHKWTIFVEEHSWKCYVDLGIASTVHSFEKNNWPGNQQGGWGYYSHGQALHNKQVVKDNFPRFKKGSVVTFVLDLTGDGILRSACSVNGKSFLKLFSDMLSKVRIVDPEGGFIPAVDLGNSDTTIRFLGLESVW
jgi:hypothetical protein